MVIDSSAALEHVRVRQNQHLQFGNNAGCAEDAVTMAVVATHVRRSTAAVVKLPNVKLL
jgi:hypothetical protein